MTTVELLALLRTTFDDTVEPYLVSDVDCLQALSRAQSDFAAETLCIFDGLTTVDAIENNPYITLPEGTVWIKAALYNSILLKTATQHELDYGYFSFNGVENVSILSNWRGQIGIPKFLVTDLGSLTSRLVPFPSVSGTITLERYRLPAELSLIQDPEIVIQYHRDLITGALVHLYEIHDADVYDPQKSLKSYTKWQLILSGAKVQLQTDLRRQERRLDLPQVVNFIQGKSNIIGSNQNDNT
jgi:hypothetical protein